MKNDELLKNIHFDIQISLCGKSKLECVRNIPVDDGTCIQGCQGLYITSYFQKELAETSYNEFWSMVEDEYDNYKGKVSAVNFLDDLNGMLINNLNIMTNVNV